MLHRLRVAMVRPERARIHGKIAMDETVVALRSRESEAEEQRARPSFSARLKFFRLVRAGHGQDGLGCAWCRTPSETIVSLCKQSVEPGSLVLSDGLSSYDILAEHGYRHRVVAAGSLDRIHMPFGNFKNWILATHHGVSSKHMQAHVNGFVFA